MLIALSVSQGSERNRYGWIRMSKTLLSRKCCWSVLWDFRLFVLLGNWGICSADLQALLFLWENQKNMETSFLKCHKAGKSSPSKIANWVLTIEWGPVGGMWLSFGGAPKVRTLICIPTEIHSRSKSYFAAYCSPLQRYSFLWILKSICSIYRYGTLANFPDFLRMIWRLHRSKTGWNLEK